MFYWANLEDGVNSLGPEYIFFLVITFSKNYITLAVDTNSIKYIMGMFLSGNLLASRKDYWFFPKNSALNLGTYFFLQRYLYSPYKIRGT